MLISRLESTLGDERLPSSFAEGSRLPSFDDDASMLRESILDATSELQDLLLQPLDLLVKYSAVRERFTESIQFSRVITLTSRVTLAQQLRLFISHRPLQHCTIGANRRPGFFCGHCQAFQPQ